MGQGLIMSVCLPVSEFAEKTGLCRWFRIKLVLSNEVTHSLWIL